MVSKYKLAEYVHDNMELIHWREGPNGGYVGKLNEADVLIAGGAVVRLTLTISADGESYTVFEPQPLEDAPIGHLIEAIKTKIFRRPPTVHEPAVQTALKLKKTLEEILHHAGAEVMAQLQDPNFEKKLRQRIWSKLTDGADLF